MKDFRTIPGFAGAIFLLAAGISACNSDIRSTGMWLLLAAVAFMVKEILSWGS
jgi:hypothetical protein